MVFNIENLGPIRAAGIEMGDLTVVCGRNNNGKTYLTYTLGTFFATIKQNLEIPISDELVTELLNRGELHLDLSRYIDTFIQALAEILPRFTDSLPRFLVMHPDRFADTHIRIDISSEEVLRYIQHDSLESDSSEIRVTDSVRLLVEQGLGTEVRIVLFNTSDVSPSRTAISKAISFMIARRFDDVPGKALFPDTFVITCERTGSMLYRQELLRNRRKDQVQYPVGNTSRKRDDGILYQHPIERELSFVFSLGTLQKSRSALAESHPEILAMLAKISGGSYLFDPETNQVKFAPEGATIPPLSLPESSSTVRSLAELYFYLAHKAAPGQLLMFDEPELNLHPSNQRLLARLLVGLVNVGIKVFVTTHSDYIIREFNALIRIGQIRHDAIRQDLMSGYGIESVSLLDPNSVRTYMLANGTVDPIEFDSDAGAFGIPSFDDTIESFNRLYSRIKMINRSEEVF